MAFPPIDDNENLVKFILSSNQFRSSDLTIKPEAFMPSIKTMDVSMFRTLDISNEELWETGNQIAKGRPAALYGKTELKAQFVRLEGLEIEETETPRNHVNIKGWPSEKSYQKMKAIELAKNAGKLIKPDIKKD